MAMRISTKGRYALRLMIDLAQNGRDRLITLKEISARQGISVKYLEQIVPKLVKAGLVQAVRGNSGGYILTRKAADYTAGEIIRTVEGRIAPVDCLETEQNCCPRANSCPTLKFWQGLDRVINLYLDQFTLENFLNSTIANSNYEKTPRT